MTDVHVNLDKSSTFKMASKARVKQPKHHSVGSHLLCCCSFLNETSGAGESSSSANAEYCIGFVMEEIGCWICGQQKKASPAATTLRACCLRSPTVSLASNVPK